MRIYIPDNLVAEQNMVTHIENEIIDKLAAIPGVTATGFGSSVPMDGIESGWDEIRVEGKDYEDANPPRRLYSYVSPGYFHTLGTRLVAGREFTWTDIYGSKPAGVVSENLARELWGTPAAAIGKRFQVIPKMPWVEVVGVVEDVRQNGVSETAPAIVYWPALHDDSHGSDRIMYATRSATFIVRSDRAGSESFLNQVQRAVWSVNANLPVSSAQTMQDIYSQSLARTSFTLVMLAIAG